MFHNPFGGHRPSLYKTNPIVSAFITSESFFWSGWNLINPIFAIFVATNIQGGNVEIAGSAVTVYLVARILTELFASRLLNKTTDRTRVLLSILGIVLLGCLYISFAFISSIGALFIIQILLGVSFGIVTPAKMSLFSEHIDKGKESSEWGLYDVVTLSGMACTAALGGFVAKEYGFPILFVTTGIMMLLGAIPFVFFARPIKND